MRRAHGEAGFTLVELLISLTLIGLMVTGLTGAILGLLRSSDTVNDVARNDTLLSSFGEVLKQLPYVACAEPGDYQGLFDAREAALAPDPTNGRTQDGRLLLAGQAASVLSVTPLGDGACAVAGSAVATDDTGSQKLDLRVTDLDGKVSTGSIVKRDPGKVPTPRPFPEMDVVEETKPPDLSASQTWEGQKWSLENRTPVAIFRVFDAGSSSPVGIYRFVVDCDGDGPELPQEAPEPGVLYCSVPRGSYSPLPTGPGQVSGDEIDEQVGQYWVVDNLGTRSVTRNLRLEVQRRMVPGDPLGVTVDWTTGSNCSASPLPKGAVQPSTTVRFCATVTNGSLGGTPDFSWDFGDPRSGPVNFSTLAEPTHVFSEPSSYQVRLQATDPDGRTASGSTTLTVTGVANPPNASFTASPSFGLAPQTVTFQAASNPAGTQYFWSFGDGSPEFAGGTSASAAKFYGSPGSYVVRLRVVKSNGEQASSQQAVTLVNTQNLVDILIIGHRISYTLDILTDANFQFRWTNVPRSPGDDIRYDLNVRKVSGWWCLSWPSAGVTIRVPAGPAGTVQTYALSIPRSFPGIVMPGCVFEYQALTVRNGEVPSESVWTEPKRYRV